MKNKPIIYFYKTCLFLLCIPVFLLGCSSANTDKLTSLSSESKQNSITTHSAEDDDLVTGQIEMELSANRKITLEPSVLYLNQDTPEEVTYLTSISIFEQDKLIQKLDFDMVQSSGFKVDFLRNLSDARIYMHDISFDGYTDFYIEYNSVRLDSAYRFFIWIPEKNHFEECTALNGYSEPHIDEKKKQLYFDDKNEYGKSEVQYVRFDGNTAVVWGKAEMVEDGSKIHHRVFERKNNKLELTEDYVKSDYDYPHPFIQSSEVEIIAGRVLTVEVCAVFPPGMAFGHISSISVFENQVLLQKIDFKPDDIEIYGFYDNFIHIEDTNFDGYPDFYFEYGMSNGPAMQYFFFWNPQLDQFDLCEEFKSLPIPQLNYERKELYFTTGSSMGFDILSYRFEKGTPVLFKVHSENRIDDYMYNYKTWEIVNGELILTENYTDVEEWEFVKGKVVVTKEYTIEGELGENYYAEGEAE